VPRYLLHKSERSHTFDALDAAWRRALRITSFDIKRDRYIVFSDTHRGNRHARTDDFVHNQDVYTHALEYYLDGDYRLVLNGDIEEGWKAGFPSIIKAYADDVYALERRFAQRGDTHYLRTYGNHDDGWADKDLVSKVLNPVMGRSVPVFPAILLGGQIFIVHGHQGDIDADRFAWFSRRVVKHIWQPLQTAFELKSLRAAENSDIRRARDWNLSAWSKMNRLMLIAGHTHRPMLTDMNRVNYINDGCCVHTDGITGIEIDQGILRLVRWAKDAHNQIQQMIYREIPLAPLLARL
jgi:UDP-2,3-diacylglucosamine pyrophosphatase LpxH